MTGTTVRSSGGRRRRILIVLLVATALLLARAGLDVWAGHRVNAEASRLEKQYGSLDEHTMSVPSVPPDDNRARAIGAAAALIVLAPNRRVQDFWEPYGAVLRQLARPVPMPADLRGFVEANRSALRIVDEARSRRGSNWEVGPTTPWMDIRTLGNTIYLASRLDLEMGRPDDAARDIASGLAVSASLRQEPDLVAQLIRCALATQQFEAVQRLLMQSEPSKASLEELARWLGENGKPDPALVGLLSELTYRNAMLERFEDGRGLVAMTDGPANAPPFWVGALLRFARPFVRIARAGYLQHMHELLDEQRGPRPRPHVDTPAPPSKWHVMDLLENATIAGLRRTMDTGDLHNGELGATELAVALRRFRLDRGHYPDALSELAPYIANVPIDPFTGQPPVYAREGPGFQLRFEGGKSFPHLTAAALEWHVPK
jgi:hypothetical protein